MLHRLAVTRYRLTQTLRHRSCCIDLMTMPCLGHGFQQCFDRDRQGAVPFGALQLTRQRHQPRTVPSPICHFGADDLARRKSTSTWRTTMGRSGPTPTLKSANWRGDDRRE